MKITRCERCGDEISYGLGFAQDFTGLIWPIPVYTRKPKFCYKCQKDIDAFLENDRQLKRNIKIKEWDSKNLKVNE